MYKKILVAVDFFDKTDQILIKARDLAVSHGAELHLMHAVEDPATAYISYDMPVLPPIDKKAVQAEVMQKLHKLADKYGVNLQNCHAEIGEVELSILATAEEEGIDLIMVGNHGRHGLKLLLLGSTAAKILQQSKQDCLVVNLTN